jgi:hypothetical protein
MVRGAAEVEHAATCVFPSAAIVEVLEPASLLFSEHPLDFAEVSRSSPWSRGSGAWASRRTSTRTARSSWVSRRRHEDTIWAVDLSMIFWLAVLAVLVLVPMLVMGRMAWRIWRHNDEMEPGGSLGRQYLSRSKARR